ncbi:MULTISPECIES: RNA polymerase sigma factor [Hyphobacterium]|uniref:RNA polymerase sigma factor n=1 Tax=Hyphobacterium vulgare TaxID=1736751 RepID=A0ABV6ZX43_9PROT
MAADPSQAGQARAAAETAARTAYGRLIAWLSARNRDVASAEDALADAFLSALETWPLRGVPERPEAWLLAVARRRLVDRARRNATAETAAPDLVRQIEEAEMTANAEASVFPDERLKLLFICAHPAIASNVHTPLMLQTVFGFDAARIAAAFLTAPAAMGQRLVRAKAKIRATRPGFGEPGRSDWPDRLGAVLSAIYAAYTAGWDDPAGLDGVRSGFAREAIALGRMTSALLPGEGEAHGLLALMLHCEARKPSRRDMAGDFIPLSRQDTSRWDRSLIAEAETALRRAIECGPPGRFALEAAIQSAHAARMVRGSADWDAIVQLYDRLVTVTPALGAQIARAAALAESGRADAGLAALDRIDPGRVSDFQPWWATRAHLLAEAGQREAAGNAYRRAADLTADPAVRDWLLKRAAML